MSQKYEKLKTLLKELFQLDQPDLDFGLYRIMHAKSAEVTPHRRPAASHRLHREGGTGIKRIRDEARAGGYPEPRFEETGFVTAIFRPNPAVRAWAEAAQSMQPDISGGA